MTSGQEGDLRIILLGKTGAGKSATGNTILGRNAFKETSEICEKQKGDVDGRNIVVFDTPGLFNASITKEQVKAEIERCVEMSAPGPHVFLLVIKLGVRFTEEERNSVQWIQENFGKEALLHTIIVFTHTDLLKGKSLDEYIRKSHHLPKIVASCGGRYHSFNNEDKNNRHQITELLQNINALRRANGRTYNPEMLKKIQRENTGKGGMTFNNTHILIVILVTVAIFLGIQQWNNRLQNHILELANEVQQLKIELRENEQRNQHLQLDLEQKEQEKQQLENELSQKEGDKKDLENKIKEKEQEKQQLENEHSQKEGEENDLKNKIEKKKEKEKQLRTELSQKEGEENDLENKIKEKKQEGYQLRNELSPNVENQNEIQTEKQQLEQENELYQKEQENHQLKKQLIQKGQENHQLKQQLIQKEQEESQLKKELLDKEQEELELKKKRLDKKKEELELKKQRLQKKQEKHQIKNNLEKNDQVKQKLEKKLQQKENEKKQLEKKLLQYKQKV